ncbi:YcxB family protein [Actinoplanes sp. CA-252034]|uniref:YcxB family protein n=1 Tax=Actinoplanes sp. CA-252034 TaxID=3239906 RepID=UPI003D97190F
MRIEFTFGRDAEYFRGQLARGARRATFPLLLLGLIAVAAGFAVMALLDRILLGALVVVAGVAVLIVWQVRLAAMMTVPLAWQSPRRWLLTDDGVESSSEVTSAEFAWSTFRSGEATKQAFLLFQEGHVMVDIPRRPLSPEQDAQLDAFLSARGLLGARNTR